MPLESDYYTPFRCGACGTRQRVYMGDPNDLTVPDVQAVRCCQCGVVEPICDEFEMEVCGGLENLHEEDGEPLGSEP